MISEDLYKMAKRLIPGGVNSPVRAYEPFPFFTKSAAGSRLRDVDGNEYIDYCMGYGALLLGHTHPEIMDAVRQQLEKGNLYGTPTQEELELAEILTKLVPSMQMVRLVNTGTEATMHLIRLARGYTGRKKILKFDGCYHGAHDSVLVEAGSSAGWLGIPSSLGIPEQVAANTLVAPFNDLEKLECIIETHGNELAAVIVEPVMGNAGLIPPNPGYLQAIRDLTRKWGILLIFDEIITGFRLAPGGAQEYYGVIPDLTALGKVMGAGFPIAAFGGRKEIMESLAPLGKVYQAGTFSGNPVSVAGSLALVRIILRESHKIYGKLRKMGDWLAKGLRDAIEDTNQSAQLNSLESMFQIFFTPNPVRDYSGAKASDRSKFMQYHRELLKRGIFIPPSQFETCFLSTSHVQEELDYMIEASYAIFKQL